MSAQKNKLLEATVTSCMNEEDLHDCKLRTVFFLLFKYRDEQARLKTKQARKQTTKKLIISLIISLCNPSVLLIIVLYQNKICNVLCLEQWDFPESSVQCWFSSSLVLLFLTYLPSLWNFHPNFPLLLLMKQQTQLYYLREFSHTRGFKIPK